MSLLVKLFKYPDLKKRILFSLVILVLYRLGSHIPISGIDLTDLNNLVSLTKRLDCSDILLIPY